MHSVDDKRDRQPLQGGIVIRTDLTRNKTSLILRLSVSYAAPMQFSQFVIQRQTRCRQIAFSLPSSIGAVKSRDMTDFRRYFTSPPRRRLSFNFDTELYRAAADLLTRRHDHSHDWPPGHPSVTPSMSLSSLYPVCLSVRSTIHSHLPSCIRHILLFYSPLWPPKLLANVSVTEID